LEPVSVLVSLSALPVQSVSRSLLPSHHLPQMGEVMRSESRR
jgi:hypothetical protein